MNAVQKSLALLQGLNVARSVGLQKVADSLARQLLERDLAGGYTPSFGVVPHQPGPGKHRERDPKTGLFLRRGDS